MSIKNNYDPGFGLIERDQFNAAATLLNGGAAMPSAVTVQAGAGTGAMRGDGNLAVQVNAAGVANAAATTDTVLFTQALPANSFSAAGQQLTIFAAGKFGATGNNKRVQIYVGSDVQTVGNAVVTTSTTSIATTGTVTTNNSGWTAEAQVTKYGAAGANTQLGVDIGTQSGAATEGTGLPVALTLTESAVNYVTITGASQTTGAASDVLAQLLQLTFSN